MSSWVNHGDRRINKHLEQQKFVHETIDCRKKKRVGCKSKRRERGVAMSTHT